jgi:hypothetical protein
MQMDNPAFGAKLRKIVEEEIEEDDLDVPIYDRVGPASAFSLK